MLRNKQVSVYVHWRVCQSLQNLFKYEFLCKLNVFSTMNVCTSIFQHFLKNSWKSVYVKVDIINHNPSFSMMLGLMNLPKRPILELFGWTETRNEALEVHL